MSSCHIAWLLAIFLSALSFSPHNFGRNILVRGGALESGRVPVSLSYLLSLYWGRDSELTEVLTYI